MAGKGSLSDWQLEEMAALYSQGWRVHSLALLYDVSDRTVERLMAQRGVVPYATRRRRERAKVD